MKCDKDIRDYHDTKVQLTVAQRRLLVERQKANRNRVKRGLKANDQPLPSNFVTQGSFAMKTIIQEPNKGYDLDEGVIFNRESLKGPLNADKKALDARKMVLDAVDDGTFKRPPEIKPNCVRIFYDDGIQVDVPVYRQDEEATDSAIELASVNWKASDPRGVNDWFAKCCHAKPSLGHLVRLAKKICKNRPSYSLPSGFVLSVLVEECYQGDSDYLDDNLHHTLLAIHERLASCATVHHPVIEKEWLIESSDDHTIVNFRKLLVTVVEELQILSLPSCTRSDALKAWKKVFRTDYFDAAIDEALDEEKEATKKIVASSPVLAQPKPWACIDCPNTTMSKKKSTGSPALRQDSTGRWR